VLVVVKIISKIITKFRLIRKIHVVFVFFILFRDTCPGASYFFLFKCRHCRNSHTEEYPFIYHVPFGEQQFLLRVFFRIEITEDVRHAQRG